MRTRALSLLALAAVVACGAAPRRAPAQAVAAGAPVRVDAREDAEDDATGGDEADGEDAVAEEPAGDAPCPPEMALVQDADRSFCVDRYEASLIEMLPDGTERPYPHYHAVDGHSVRAVSVPGVYPQGYISELQAEEACAASGKRLCTHPEWKTACKGPGGTTFPYGEERRAGVCNDSGRSAVVAVFGAKAVAASPVSPSIAAANARRGRPAHATTRTKVASTTKARAPRGRAKPPKTKKKVAKKKAKTKVRGSTRPASVELNVWTQLNDARLGQVEGALAKTGAHSGCANGWGLVDMVGNLHEWVATDPDAPRGTFAGGYYLDTSLNGDGCEYRTQAHAHDYHDYSTGFRCCADPK